MTIPLLRTPKPCWRRVALPMILGSALAVFGIVGSPSTGTVMAQAPDMCALLKPDEIQLLAVNAQVGSGVPSAIPSVGRVACRYQWGAGTGRYTLDIIVNDASRMYSNIAPDAIKSSLARSGLDGTVTELIQDTGEAAALTSDSPMLATATAYTKGRVLQLNLEGYDARAKKDQLIALLKAGTSRF